MRAALAALFLVACGNTSPVPPDAPSSSAAVGDCAALCAQARALGCPAFSATPEGEPCERWCPRVAKFDHWDLACKSAAKTCGAIDQCPALP
jgi:hypothetical protein